MNSMLSTLLPAPGHGGGLVRAGSDRGASRSIVDRGLARQGPIGIMALEAHPFLSDP